MVRSKESLPVLKCRKNRPHGSRGWIVGVNIILHGHTPLQVFKKLTLAGVRYSDGVLCFLFGEQLDFFFILKNGNAWLHRTYLEFLKSEYFRLMFWTERSLDLHTIEGIWYCQWRTNAIHRPRLRETPGT